MKVHVYKMTTLKSGQVTFGTLKDLAEMHHLNPQRFTGKKRNDTKKRRIDDLGYFKLSVNEMILNKIMVRLMSATLSAMIPLKGKKASPGQWSLYFRERAYDEAKKIQATSRVGEIK